jgi:GntR family transcriptional regulator
MWAFFWGKKPHEMSGSHDTNPASAIDIMKPASEPIAKPAQGDFAPLDKGSFTPLYFQIQTQLTERIRGGGLRTGQALPGEEELARIFGVSRMTARQALQGLKSAGMAQRERGRGTFVVEPKVEKDITNRMGFSAEMRALGKRPTARILARTTMPAEPHNAERLAIAPGAAVCMLRRLRFADDKPLAIEEVFLPLDRFPGIETIDFSHTSLYDTMRSRYNVRFGSADEVIEARTSTREESATLEIRLHSSLLVIARILFDAADRPIESSRSLYRGDLYRAVFRIPANM